ncbi:uncharacterized protein FOMMEDRAFT_157996 [Fomitiporia mediterranea MF3/22]|uniref:uncharacterized protein n=1 Tax=Fomitiporia mediterranea (strain MF3/22) TaxID=694068 RepID=UPI0004407CE5|nr:uncharacterized protein FOMMEDRAFT_157996 [Fomitiporia mediterranea MF3/22]EJD00881.1 hypothetical protein FOMMEDRAFT_157996 [Fomitiporia mediterranea MF3/22]
MSWNRHGGGGRRRNNRDEYDDRLGREVYETPEQHLRTTIIHYGNVDADQELARVAKEIREENARSSNVPAIAEGFRIGVTEEPYKIPHYAALLRALDEGAEGTTDTMLGKQVLDDFWKGFQGFLDKLAWRQIRLCVHFFAHLTSAQVISVSSLLSLLQSFTAALEEFGVSHSRAKNAALCAAEGLMRAGPELKSQSPSEVTEIISAIQTYAETSSGSKLLASPLVKLHTESDAFEGTSELLDNAIAVLKSLDENDFSDCDSSFLKPYSVKSDDPAPYFDLPSVLVPPEAIELESLTGVAEDSAAVVKNEEWPEYRIRTFANDMTADPTTVLGYAVNVLISDVIDIFEVNRKECARFLFELPKWLPSGTFKPRPGVPSENGAASGPLWQLESCIMESILAKMLVLPRPLHRPMYYIALITELCKLQPSTTGPAVGKSIRKLYGYLVDGLDVAAAHRFTEWFATHMSNFGFQWVWKEWVPDLSLPSHHPKRNFIRRAIEIEIRLAYFDRIQKTLPEAYQAPGTDALPDEAPGPEFTYDDPRNPYHEPAEQLLNLLRGRAKAEDVNTHLDTLKSTVADLSEGDVRVDAVVRSITVQALLHIGSRSFSHFLNAIERYLLLLRTLSSGAEAKQDILNAVAQFWQRNRQMVRIVFDKLMQYQIVDPSDVIAWAFSPHPQDEDTNVERIDTFRWEIIENALDKANGRVMIARKKVTTLRKEEDDSRARSTYTALEEKPAEDSPALRTALKAYSTLSSEQRAVLSKTLNEFVNALSDTSAVLTESSWDNRSNWTNTEWNIWETWGWYRNFCRLFAPYLRAYSTALGTVAFAKVESSEDDAAKLLKRVWNVSTGQEA